MRLSFSRVLSAAMCGMEVIPVQVEADVSNGTAVDSECAVIWERSARSRGACRTATRMPGAACHPNDGD